MIVHFVTVINAKMSLHMKWLITLFTSGIYDIVYNGIQGYYVSEVFGHISHVK